MAKTNKDEGAAGEAKAPKYTKADKKAIGLLQDAGVELTGTETPEELEALVEEKGLGEDDGGAEVIPGVPNQVPVLLEPVEPGSKAKPFALYQVVAVKGGHCLYNEKGVRVSHVCSAAKVHGRDADIKDKVPGEISEFAYIAKAAARSNADRKARRLPNDPA